MDDGGATTIMTRKMANNGKNLPTSATSGLPPAARIQARLLRWENSEPTA